MVKIAGPGAMPGDPGVDVLNAMVVVDPESGVDADHFRYQTLGSSIVLSANTTYYVVSHETARTTDAGADEWHDFDTMVDTTLMDASVSEGVYQADAEPGIYRPSTGGPGRAYVPVNLLYRPVP